MLYGTPLSNVRQRVWSAKDQRALTSGAYVGCAMTIFVTLFFAGGGFLAGWAGFVDLNNDAEINSAFFSILKPMGQSEVPVGILALVCLLAATMNESAVDSFQNAILDTLISFLVSIGLHVNVNMTRSVVVFINIPIMIIGMQGLPIINLYLLPNILTTCATVPLLSGLFPSLDTLVQGDSALFGSLFATASVCLVGKLKYGSWSEGMATFFYKEYRWEAFVTGIISSAIGITLYSLAVSTVSTFCLEQAQSNTVPGHRQQMHSESGASGISQATMLDLKAFNESNQP